ncbi:MAG: Cof-type HAD-IIB family hydrolase [Pyrinomonadaceae bacterium]
MIKLLALDLDGTLLDSSGKISEQNKIAIRRAEELGALVTICTGRRFRDARPVALELQLNAPVISHNGALLKFADTLETVAASILPNETIREILRVGKNFGADAMISADPAGKGVLLYDRISDENVSLQKYIEWSKKLHGAESGEAVLHVESLAEILDDYETVHVSFSGGCAAMAHLETILQSELEKKANVLTTRYSSLDFTLIDILPSDASKGIGVEKLALFENLTAANVMAIGDNFNDSEMLEFAGTPVLMGNSAPELLENKNYYQTLSNDESGVARAIEKFILAK